jgi:hypothetical protein
MTKEEIIRNLKYTKEKYDHYKVDTFGTNITLMCEDVLKVLNNCIEIPEGATNGDMFVAVWGYAPSHLRVYADWWNAPYKKGDK